MYVNQRKEVQLKPTKLQKVAMNMEEISVTNPTCQQGKVEKKQFVQNLKTIFVIIT